MATETGNATVQQAVLAALSDAGRCISFDELTERTGLARHQVSHGAGGLIERGFVVRRERGCYEVTQTGADFRATGAPLSGGPTGPLPRMRATPKALPTRLWRAIRMRRKFTIGDLLDLAAGEEATPRSMAHRYVRALQQAGYLAELRPTKGEGPGRPPAKRYALIRDSGPLTPIARARAPEVYDPNTGTTHPRLRDGGRP